MQAASFIIFSVHFYKYAATHCPGDPRDTTRTRAGVAIRPEQQRRRSWLLAQAQQTRTQSGAGSAAVADVGTLAPHVRRNRHGAAQGWKKDPGKCRPGQPAAQRQPKNLKN